jgi:hypothetical protein
MNYSSGANTNKNKVNYPVFNMNHSAFSNDVEMTPITRVESVKK